MKINARTDTGYLFAVLTGKLADEILLASIPHTDAKSTGDSKIFVFNDDMMENFGELQLMFYKGYFLQVIG